MRNHLSQAATGAGADNHPGKHLYHDFHSSNGRCGDRALFSACNRADFHYGTVGSAGEAGSHRMQTTCGRKTGCRRDREAHRGQGTEETKTFRTCCGGNKSSRTTIPTEPPTQAIIPAETEATIPSQPVSQPQPEPEFEIEYWIDYASNYARSLGLKLGADAVDCWDNPITAGAHCVYLERDIRNRLSRYSKDEDITDVWIWAVDLGKGIYDLYIGYA